MFDIIVIGGGPAGVTAALRASELGAQVALVERDRLGGTCTNDGCVPTRVLAKAARLLRDAQQFSDYGLIGEEPKLDFGRLLAQTQRVVYKIEEKKQLIKHLEESGVHVYANAGAAHFVDPHTVTLSYGEPLEGKQFIICVGGQPRRLDFPGAELALTHSDVWSLEKLPRSVVIVGASATGCQLASIFNAFGSQVRLLDIAPRILSTEDVHVSKELTSAFINRGIEVITGIEGVERIEKRRRWLHFNYTQNGQAQRLSTEAVVLAVGWPGNVEDLNLPAANVATAHNFIPVDVQLRTNVPHIFAAGDITGSMMLVQSASYEARIAAENAVQGDNAAFIERIVPHGGFTDPEYGSVGLTEEAARQRFDYAVAVVPYADLDRAVIDGRPEGFCKLIATRESHRIVGAHVVGEQALEIVQIIAAGMAADVRVEQLAELELAYPTFTAIVGLVARRLVRELGLEPLAVQWRALRNRAGAEWERRDSG